VVQVHFLSSVKTDKLEGDSSGAYLKNSCSILGTPWLGECAEIMEQLTWMSLEVVLGIFGCSPRGGLRKLPNSLMRCVG